MLVGRCSLGLNRMLTKYDRPGGVVLKDIAI